MGHVLPEFTDKADCGGVSKILTIAAGAIVELKVGLDPLENREFVEWEALDTGVKWGFGNGVGERPHDSHKSQQFTRPYGPNVTVFFENTKVVPVDVAISEVN